MKQLAVAAPMTLTCALLIWAPLPLGSNRPWSWSLLAVWAALALLAWAVAQLAVSGPRPRAAWPVTLAALTTLPVWGFAFVQTLPAADVAGLAPHPLWPQARAAGMTDAVPLPGLDAAAGRDALMRLMSYAAVFWLVWRLAQDGGRARRLLAVILATITACAAYGLANHLAGSETIGWLPKTAYIGDVTATFVNRNSFATYANLGVIICLVLLAEPFFGVRSLADVRRIAAESAGRLLDRRVLVLLALAVLAMASLQSHSRGGLLSLGMTVVVLVFVLFLITRPRPVAALALLVATMLGGWGLLSVSGGITLERLGQIDANYDLDAAGRLTFWQTSLAMVAERPWQGHGYGNFEAAFAQHRDERFTDRVDMAHNTYLEHLVELGVPATLLLYAGPLLLFGYCLRGVFVRRRDHVFPLVAVGATVLVALHALVDFSLQIPAVAVTYAALLGIGVAQATPSPSRPSQPGASLRD
jgi:O-antigen ligase